MDEERNFQAQPPNAVFTMGGGPVLICLHSTMSAGARQAMAKKIMEAGGDPTADLDEARVIICSESHPVFKQLTHKLEHDRFKWVEPPSWVDACIRERTYGHDGYHTRLKGRSRCGRVEFSPSDKMHLIEFLATRVPFKHRPGGRLGNELYKDLCHPDRAQQYPWACRHTWQSWRNHYKQNQDILDPKIQTVVDSNPFPPEPGEKGQYIPDYSAKASTRERRKGAAQKIGYEFEPGEDDAFEEEEEEEEEEEVQTQVERKKEGPDVEDSVKTPRRSPLQEAFDNPEEDPQAPTLEITEPPQKKARTMRQESIDADDFQDDRMPNILNFDSSLPVEHNTPTPGPSRLPQADLSGSNGLNAAVRTSQTGLAPVLPSDTQATPSSPSPSQRITRNAGKGKAPTTLPSGRVTRSGSMSASLGLASLPRMTRARASAERKLAVIKGRDQNPPSRDRGQMLPPIREANLVVSAPLGANASAREESQVEHTLQPHPKDGTMDMEVEEEEEEEEDSGSGESSNDQQANDLLRKANEQRQRVLQSESRHNTPSILQSSPRRISSPSFKVMVDSDSDATPKHEQASAELMSDLKKAFERANYAKIRKMPHTSPVGSSMQASSDGEDSQSIVDTSDSIPAEDTKAYIHKGEHRMDFTPAAGTKAEAHLSGTRRKGKNKGR